MGKLLEMSGNWPHSLTISIEQNNGLGGSVTFHPNKFTRAELLKQAMRFITVELNVGEDNG